MNHPEYLKEVYEMLSRAFSPKEVDYLEQLKDTWDDIQEAKYDPFDDILNSPEDLRPRLNTTLPPI